MPKQRTIKTPVTVSGVGLHTGEKVSLTFKPAPENHWYKFQRIDLPDKPIIEADADNVISTNHGTTLEQNGARVHTTEHVLAALVGLEIDNCLIEVTGPEMRQYTSRGGAFWARAFSQALSAAFGSACSSKMSPNVRYPAPDSVSAD